MPPYAHKFNLPFTLPEGENRPRRPANTPQHLPLSFLTHAPPLFAKKNPLAFSRSVPVGSKLDLRDLDFIWCACTVVKVYSKEGAGEGGEGRALLDGPGQGCVKLRYDGWGEEWDETVQWPNDRLAR